MSQFRIINLFLHRHTSYRFFFLGERWQIQNLSNLHNFWPHELLRPESAHQPFRLKHWLRANELDGGRLVLPQDTWETSHPLCWNMADGTLPSRPIRGLLSPSSWHSHVEAEFHPPTSLEEEDAEPGEVALGSTSQERATLQWMGRGPALGGACASLPVGAAQHST